MPSIEKIAAAIPTDPQLKETERSAIIAIATIAVGVDRAIHRDEVTLLQQIAKQLGVKHETEFAALFADLGANAPAEAASIRLRGAADRLDSATAREIAYTVAYAITIADLDTHEKESAFHRELAATLSLSEETAERLARNVTDTLLAG
jgi:hypothetical protein